MKHLAKATLIVGLLIGGALVTIVPGAEAGTNVPFFFGMESSSVSAQTNAGVKPDVGALWVGPWTLKSGWGGPDSSMRAMRDQGVTPAIHFYYWGDDISPSCIENGCWSSLHNTHKSKAGWQTLAQQLTDHLNSQMQGKEVLIFVETEFNKGGVGSYEPMDGYMADKASFIKNKYPNAKVVTAFGNWDSGNWYRFDRIAAKSDYVGLQAMRGSTRDSWSEYDTAYEKTLAGAKKLKGLFGKPVLVHDLALSSYPESSYKTKQANELKQFFTGIGELKAAGVKGLIYRSWYDNPNFDLNNYYGQAERHWGVVYSGGSYKTSANVWIDGVKAARAGTTSSGSTGSTGTFSASFAPQSGSNEWWIDVKVGGTKSIGKVEAKVNGGSYQALSKSSWGTWTKSMHAPKGSDVVFRATATDGSTATSGTYQWLGGTSTSTPPSAPSTFTATFSPRSASNEWWIDVKVSSSKSIGKVEAKVNGGSYQTLSKSSWGTWTKSMHAPKGSDVMFRATATDGSTATSGTYQWLDGASTTTSPSAFSATFSPQSASNEWWIDVKVSSTKTISKVEAKVNGGSYQTLSKSSWGTWTKSMHAPKGSDVMFRATASDGSTATSGTYQWLGGTSTTTSPSAFSATFSPQSASNEWWIDVKVSSTKTISKVEAKVDGGSYRTLSKSNWGTWTESMHAPRGSDVVFRATASDGSTATSGTYQWLTGTSAGASFDATFNVKDTSNNWWVEVYVAGKGVTKVEVRADGGSWNTLPKESWGAYANSLYIKDGAKVQFRATDGSGQTDLSQTIIWS